MSNQVIEDTEVIKELQALHSWAVGTAEIAARLIKRLQPVSTGRSKKKVLSDAEIARLLERKNRRFNNLQTPSPLPPQSNKTHP
ncbi:hypothetical protein DXN05_03575 [Deminuibacter soli]|uniref:Uncharacterized protein n=1 Tax=Deminuibacter soli TaxID=2291815 RepID=A0A3E1NQ58_9BACT|nr:hypothetical protein DXN05_03575 [Deminuibacter soli]